MFQTRRSASALFGATLLLAGAGADARGQVVRGTVRVSMSSVPIGSATVTARDSMGTTLAAVVTDSVGRFAFRLSPRPPFDLAVRRLGYAALNTRVRALAATDTLDLEILLTEVAAAAEAVTITAAPSLNEKRLLEAHRRGWKVYEPEMIAAVRDRAPDLPQLMRTLGTTSMSLPRGPNDCFRAMRNNQCLTIVVDGQVLGPTALVLPSDIYFLAVLGASEARVQFGDRAPWGAIAIYTRSRYDRTPRRP